MIRSELKYSIGVTVVILKCQVVGDKTNPFPMHPFVHVVRRVARLQWWVEPGPEPTWEFAPGVYPTLSHNFVTSGIEVFLSVAGQPYLPSSEVRKEEE
jgi:hypothetical protein